MTPLFVAISFAGGAFATLAVVQLMRPLLRGRYLWPALAAGVLTALLTTTLGAATGLARPEFLLALSFFALPVLVLLEAAAIGSGAGRRGRWALMLTWGLVVFPGATLVPIALTEPCRFSGCAFVDFGGALPLFVSSSAFVLLARLARQPGATPVVRGNEAIAGLLGFWFAFVVWLTSLEAAFDAYIPRILFAALVGPAAGALGWLLVDRLKAVDRTVPRSIGFGLLAGIAATASGAVTVSFPWTAAVGAFAGVLAAVIHSSRPAVKAGLATRWGFALLGATAVGFLAPPIAGDTIGVLVTVQVGSLAAPLVAFAAVALAALLISVPIWMLVRRRQVAVGMP